MSETKESVDFVEEVEMMKPAIEAVIFASQYPLDIAQLSEIFSEVSRDVIKTSLSQLKEEYANSKKGMDFVDVSGGYQFRTKPEYKNYIVKLTNTKPARLSQSALEVLAIIAYKQPIIKSEIEDIRGVDSGHVIRTLLEKKLIKIIGKKDVVGKPLLYSTTKEFLQAFSLKSLSSLPTLKNIKELESEEADDSQLSLL